jgi:hypothetical protein
MPSRPWRTYVSVFSGQRVATGVRSRIDYEALRSGGRHLGREVAQDVDRRGEGSDDLVRIVRHGTIDDALVNVPGDWVSAVVTHPAELFDGFAVGDHVGQRGHCRPSVVAEEPVRWSAVRLGQGERRLERRHRFGVAVLAPWAAMGLIDA